MKKAIPYIATVLVTVLVTVVVTWVVLWCINAQKQLNKGREVCHAYGYQDINMVFLNKGYTTAQCITRYSDIKNIEFNPNK